MSDISSHIETTEITKTIEKKKRIKKVKDTDIPVKTRTSKTYNLLPYQNERQIEIGIDEAGAGTFFGSLFVAGVILPKNIKELMENDKKVIIRDSKKMNQKQRDYAYDFIINNAIEYCIISKTNEEVDNINILRARLTGFHDVIKNIKKTKIDKILVDGDKFESYFDEDGRRIESECVVDGDNTYMSIAAASILAKTSQIRHIEKLVEENPDFKKYDIHNNHGYGTARHLNGIKEFGITPYHRLSFGICRKYSSGRFAEKADNIYKKNNTSTIFKLTKENLDKLNEEYISPCGAANIIPMGLCKQDASFCQSFDDSFLFDKSANEKEKVYLFTKKN